MNTSFQPERVIGIIDSLAANIEAEMPDHIERFNWPRSMSDWYDELNILTDFAEERLPELTENLMVQFELEGTFGLTTTVSDPQQGCIEICGVDVPAQFSGPYFSNVPITFRAVPAEGCTFLGWQGASNSVNSEIELVLSSDASITAIFVPAEPLTHIHINELSSKSENAIQDDFGESEDWIEIYNSGSDPVQLAGLFLTDSLPDLDKYMIPLGNSNSTIVYPDSSVVLYADSDPEQGSLHLNFKLSNQGETILLSQRVGDELIILDSVSYIGQFAGNTTGLLPDGTGDWQITLPTPRDLNMGIPFLSGLHINEFSASNHSISDHHGEYDDWIEIYNDNEEPVDIGGLFLTDSLADETNYRIPTTSPDSTTIPPKGYLVLWADNQPEQGIWHLGFGLRREGEQIGLVQKDGSSFIDSLTYKEQYTASSLSRYPDANEQWANLPMTPGSENIDKRITGLYINEFSASNGALLADENGEFDDWIEIYNDNEESVDIGGLFMTDSLANGTRYRIPTTSPDSTTIPPKGYLVLWADNQPEQGILHLGFGLRRSGEQIGLLLYNGVEFIDSLTYTEQYTASSMSRYPDAIEHWANLPMTPGSENINMRSTGLYINEFSASNGAILADENGEFDDWIEIYNSTDEALDLGGLFLTDSLDHTTRYRIPTTSPDSTTIPPKGYLVLWADNQPEQGILHLDFGLRRSGEQLGLIQYDGSDYIDSLTYPEQYSDASVSRYPDGEEVWFHLPSTPGDENEYHTISGLYITEFSTSNVSYLTDNVGEYADWIELYNDNDTPVDVGGLFITDSLANGTRYRIPTTFSDSTTIPSKDYLVLWADNQPEQGILHLGFGLSRSGEQIGLLQYNGFDYIDSLTYGQQYENASLSCIPHGTTSWIPVPPTPGERNDHVAVSGLYINEFSSSNSYLMMDNYGEFDDWIEIYNDNDRAVDLGGLFITDSLADGTKHRIPTTAPDSTTIPAKGFKILWADNQEEQGVLHLDFGLTREGEEIGLLQYNGWDFIDTLTYGEIQANTSLSRYPDGTSSWLSMNSTPGQSNIKKEYQRLCINEFRAGDPSKNSTAQYLEGNWIELFNNNEYEIDVGGLYVTNDLDHPYLCRIPDTVPYSTTIPPRGFLLLWCDNMENEGILHMNFTLAQQGTEIGLARRIGNEYFYIDTLVSSYQHVSVSTGRVIDGVNSWTNFTDPTPGWSNSQSLTSVPSMESGEFKVYPNPVSNGMLYFSEIRSIKLFDQLGILMKVEKNTNHLNVSKLPEGLYFLKTEQGEVVRIVIVGYK